MKAPRQRILTSLILISLTLTLHGQNKDVLEMINNQNGWITHVQWFESERDANGYISQIHKFSNESLLDTRKAIDEDVEIAKEVLSTERAIGGKKKGKKRDRELSKHFTDLEYAKTMFAKAEETVRLHDMISNAIDKELSTRTPPLMPSGALKSFYYSTNNGFAGYRLEISLKRTSNGGVLNITKDERMRYDGEENKKTSEVEVGDDVFDKVRSMIEEGHLYEIGRQYMPDYMITDASNWSLDMYFDGAAISSSGYATGPDHHDTLHKILDYLRSICPDSNP